MFGVLRVLAACAISGLLTAAEPSQVVRLVIDDLVEGRYDAEVIAYYRDGTFHHGYAVVPERDNLAHRIDLTPSSAIQFQTAAGEPLDISPELRGKYSYKRPEFAQMRGQYAAGEIVVAHPDPVAPLVWNDDRISGTVDVLILQVDEPNTSGRKPFSLVYRLAVDGQLDSDGGLSGSVVSWSYPSKDDTYGADAPRTQGALAGGLVRDHWRADTVDAIDPARSWPQSRGPDLTNSVAAPDGDLVDSLHDARLVWVGEELIGGGRSGGLSRGDFALFPISWTSIGYGGYAGPTVVGNDLFLHVMRPDEAVLDAVEGIERNIYVRLGADRRALANKHNAYRDEVWCVDARTGQTKWRFLSERTFGNLPSSKSGRGTTVCAFDGKLYVVGSGGLYCLDAATGAVVWRRGGENGVGYGSGGATGSRDVSAVAIGDAIVISRGGTLVGVDPETGDQRWKVENAIGVRGLPAKVVIDGRELVVGVGTLSVPKRRDRERGALPTPEDLVVIDPATGEEVLRSQALGSSSLGPLVWQDMIVANGVREDTEKKASDRHRVSGARLSAAGAERIWDNPQIAYPPGRATPLVHNGVAYIDSRRSGFAAVDMATGETLGRLPAIYSMTGGSHNWTWHIATGDRIITSFGAMVSTADKGFRPLPGRLALDYASGYVCPIKPAIADGRLFVRLANRLVCYDLRKPADQETQVLSLVAHDAMAGVEAERDDIHLRLRVRDGDLLDVSANWPRISQGDRTGIPSWLGEYRHLPWRKTLPENLVMDADGIRGEAVVRIAYNHEDWSLNLRETDDRWQGTYTRRASPLATPLSTAGGLNGSLHVLETGNRVLALTLERGIASGSELRQGEAGQNLGLRLEFDAAGAPVRGTAWSGRVNTQPWAVDISELRLTDAGLNGALTVLVIDDQYFDYAFESAEAEFRTAGSGGTVAARYEVTAAANGDGWIGSFEGVIGVPWERSGELSGTWHTSDPLVP